jgi:hypothetical protein
VLPRSFYPYHTPHFTLRDTSHPSLSLIQALLLSINGMLRIACCPCLHSSPIMAPILTTPLPDWSGLATGLYPSSSFLSFQPFGVLSRDSLTTPPSHSVHACMSQLAPIHPPILPSQLPFSEDVSRSRSLLCCFPLLIQQEAVKAHPEEARAGVSRPILKK